LPLVQTAFSKTKNAARSETIQQHNPNQQVKPTTQIPQFPTNQQQLHPSSPTAQPHPLFNFLSQLARRGAAATKSSSSKGNKE